VSVARLAFLLLLLVPIPARAADAPAVSPDPDKPRSAFVELDASFVTIRSAPALTLYDGAGKGGRPIQGFPGDFVPGPGAVFVPAAHVGFVLRLAPHLLLPISGFTVGFAPNRYADISTEQVSWHGDGLLTFAHVDLVGIGFEQRWGRYTVHATLRTGGYATVVGGTLHQGTGERNGTGIGGGAGVRAEVRGCWHESNTLGVCAFAGPSLIEYAGDFHSGETRAFNELIFGLGVVLGGRH